MKKAYERLTAREVLQLAAPHTWPASVLPSLFGIAYCYFKGYLMTPAMSLVLLAICVLMQSGVNTINDFADYIKGTDDRDDCLEESDAVLLYHPVDPLHVLAAGLGFLVVAGILGMWIVALSGAAPLTVGLIGAAAVLLYSGGPLPLSYLPVGELVSGGVMGGLIPMGILAAASGELHGEILFWSLPFILGISLIMLSNNGCDIEKDEKAGRHTLAVLLGKERTVFLYHVLVWLWLFFICVCACLISGIWGLTAPVLLLVGGRKVFAEQAGTKLLQEQRIWQMKSVLKANVAGNGAYFLAIAAALIGRRLL